MKSKSDIVRVLMAIASQSVRGEVLFWAGVETPEMRCPVAFDSQELLFEADNDAMYPVITDDFDYMFAWLQEPPAFNRLEEIATSIRAIEADVLTNNLDSQEGVVAILEHAERFCEVIESCETKVVLTEEGAKKHGEAFATKKFSVQIIKEDDDGKENDLEE